MSSSFEKNDKQLPSSVHFNLSEKFGGPADADWVAGDKGYTVTQGGVTLSVHVSPKTIQKALNHIESGKEREAFLILNGPF